MNPKAAPILLVDDNAFSRRLLARSLEMSGFEVMECGSGREALKLVDTGQPMLLVLDYEMPEMTGVEVCAHVRANIQPAIATLPIILLTAHIGEKHEIECLSAGADDFVTKPVNFEDLELTMEKTIKHVAQLRETMKAIKVLNCFINPPEPVFQLQRV